MKSTTQRLREAASQHGNALVVAGGQVAVLERPERAHLGSDDLTRWCPKCKERAVPMRDGSCGFCATQLVALKDAMVPALEIRPTGDVSTLEGLAAIANAAHEQVRLHGQELLKRAIAAGDALLRAKEMVDTGRWIKWADRNLTMDITTAYRYMRLAEHREVVIDSEADSIGAAMRELADLPRRGHGPLKYSRADREAMVALANEIGVKPAAKAFGCSPSTVHKYAGKTTLNNGARNRMRLVSSQITDDRIERVAEWLCERFGSFDFPERVTADVRADAARLLHAIFDAEEAGE